MLRHCGLFEGIGGFSRAAEQVGGIVTTQYVDLNPDAQRVYASQFRGVPIWGDIRTYHPQRGEFDLITCTFPCTGTSSAGKREGLQHPDSALWREGLRCLIECRPRFFVIEQQSRSGQTRTSSNTWRTPNGRIQLGRSAAHIGSGTRSGSRKTPIVCHFLP